MKERFSKNKKYRGIKVNTALKKIFIDLDRFFEGCTYMFLKNGIRAKTR